MVVTHFGFVEAGFSPACAALKGGATSKCVTAYGSGNLFPVLGSSGTEGR